MKNFKQFINYKERSFITIILDIFFIPIMFVLGGFKKDSLQWSHRWNIQKHVDPKLFDERISLNIPGSIESKYYAGLEYLRFHMPLFGGWQDYVIIKPEDESIKDWQICWKGNYHHKSFQKSQFKLTTPVKMLKGPNDTDFYAFDSTGKQIALIKTDEGRLGDGRYSDLPLL